MHFDDLTIYGYLGGPTRLNVLNVGWLSAGHPYRTGKMAPELLELLKELAASPANRCRGSHACELCAADPARGNGEVRIQGPDGKIYAAPALIAHYVGEHGYLPPDEFLQALATSSPSGSRKRR